ncbi:ATP-binding cassette subfamily C protein [Actinomadura pelletieri DSM 43383]|uniref:ATP-binding cassette subfamily C protein n=1 Tax=Actinomadura pelletieri DSM 43383 TaxID=1120940 RepID=A0A495QAX9_9ACTN|nr:ABC transporter ATP-binding protein [Actinomadura pelletieri]RKS68848.1 ATP-binding cassette subfamily C protein [Actinomadura pelletieri DSM 43383]
MIAAPPAVRLLRRHLRGRGPALRRLAAWSALESLPALASGLLLARAIDHGFLADRPLTGLAWLGALAVLYIAGAVGTGRIYPWLAATVEPMRDSLVREVVTAALHRISDRSPDAAGAGASQVTEQAEAVRALLGTALRNVRQLLSAGVAALVGLTLLSPPLALVACGSVGLALTVFAAFLGMQVRRYRAVVREAERIGETAAVIVHGVRDVAACAAEDRAARTVGEAVDAQAGALRAYARTRLVRLPVLGLGVHLPLLALLALSPYLTARHGLTAGEVAGGAVYLVTGLQPGIIVLVDTGGTLLLSLAVMLGRLAEVCAIPAPPSIIAPVAGPVAAPVAAPGSFDIETDHLTFAYAPGAEPVLTDVSLYVPEGTHLAVVGPSGTGKSTLANLLTGLLRPQKGTVTLGGVPVPDLDPARLRSAVTLVPQESYVFAGALRDNLVYLCPQATDRQLDRAVDAVGLSGTVERLGGYDAEIPPGGGALSHGERQLITLARAYLSPAPITILDEATSHLDPAAEARAEQALADRGGTLIVIAHRISSAERADLILLLDGSTPVIGSHDALMRHNSLYAELVGHWHT